MFVDASIVVKCSLVSNYKKVFFSPAHSCANQILFFTKNHFHSDLDATKRDMHENEESFIPKERLNCI